MVPALPRDLELYRRPELLVRESASDGRLRPLNAQQALAVLVPHPARELFQLGLLWGLLQMCFVNDVRFYSRRPVQPNRL